MVVTAGEPFFSKDDAHAGHKRILLLSYHFPPDSSMGALRWEKMIATGAERGWRADVISMPPSDAHGYDATRLNALPPGTRLFGLKLDRHPWLEVEKLVRNGKRRSPAAAAGATNATVLGKAANNH